MIVSAMEWIRDLTMRATKGEIIETPDGRLWSHGGILSHLPGERKHPEPRMLEFGTLSSLADYIVKDVDDLGIARDSHVIHVDSHAEVLYLSTIYKPTAQRFTRASAAISANGEPRFGKWQLQDEAVIWLQTHFVDNTDRARALALIGKLKKESVRQQDDDGVTQTVTTRGGITLGPVQDIVNPFVLAPYRTFREIQQPESPFILRVRETSTNMEVALFEADCGSWKLEARQSIARRLRELTADVTIIILV